MFRFSNNALQRWGRAFVVALCLPLLLLLPAILESHHSCHLHFVPTDSAASSMLQRDSARADSHETADFCASCALLRTLLADEEGKAVRSACTAAPALGRAPTEELIAGKRAKGTPSPRGPPADQ